MNRKTWLASVLLFLTVLFAASSQAEASWIRNSAGTYVYYSVSGSVLSSQWVNDSQAGLVKIGRYTYCYRLDGSPYTGWIQVEGDRYYINKNGKMLTSRWISWNDSRFYAGKDGKLYRSRIAKIGSYSYGFDEDGAMMRGKAAVNGKTYYFYKKNGRMLKKVFVLIAGKKYYFGASGVMGSRVWVKNYYVNADGYVATDTWVGSRYVGSDGHPLKGLQQIDGIYYYFDTGTYKKLTSTTKTIDGISYTFDASGKGTAEDGVNETQKASVSVQKTYYTDPVVTDEVLLSAIIYCESGNQPYYGQVAVGMVITNRMRSTSFPSKLKEVVYQTVQFSPTFDGALTRALKNQSLITDSCRQAAAEVLSKYKAGNYSITVKDKTISLKSYLFFMTKEAYLRLNLASAYKKLGDHVFFKKWQY